MLAITTCGVAQVIVAIVAKCHIYDTATAEVLDTTNIVAYGITVLNAKHQSTAPFMLEMIEVIWRISYTYAIGTMSHHGLYLGEQALGLCKCGLKGCLVALKLS